VVRGHEHIGSAYERETRIKRWRRAWKLALIEAMNPQWLDLYPWIAGAAPPPLPALRGAARLAFSFRTKFNHRSPDDPRT
jgi:putative endonuclease